jgi:SNF2 family DNA or RNA helicase
MLIDIKHNKFYISFSYDHALVQLIKQLPDRAWDPSNKIWKVPASLEALKFIQDGAHGAFNLTDQVKAWIAETESIGRQIRFAQKFKDQNELPTDYNFKTKPFDHQVKCFNFFKNLNMGGLFLEMGLGKTKVVIDVIAYHKLMGNIHGPILYICPNSVVTNTFREFELHSPVQFKLCCLEGNKAKRRFLLSKDFDVYIVNYEAIHSLYDELIDKKFECIICDESTRIKNPQAQCSKTIHKLGQMAKYRFILTGTPITQSVIDIYSQYKFIESTIFGHSFYAFKNKYAVMGGYMNKEIVGYRGLDELKALLYQTAIRFTKEECLDLPPKIYEVKEFSLNKTEQDLYKKIKESIFIELMGQKISAALVITKLLKLLEITSGFIKTDEGKNIGIKDCTKLKLLKETIEDILPSKVIIWCNFTANIHMIEKLFTEMGVGYAKLSGEISTKDRQVEIDKFQQDPECKVFIGQIKSGGMGLNLTAASYAIYYTNTYSLADRLQSEDRCHRIGQVNKVTYIDLVAKSTIEQSIIKILKGKLDLATLIIDSENLKKIIEGQI